MSWDPKAVDVDAIALTDVGRELGRECGLRANVYAKWIDVNKLTVEAANAQLGAMLSGYQIIRAIVQSGIGDVAELATMLKAWARIKEKGGLKRLGAAYAVLEAVEAGQDISAITELVKTFPGAKVTGASAPKDLGQGDLAEAA